MLKRERGAYTQRRLLSAPEAADYLGLGKNSARAFAEECGAVLHYGTRVLFDRAALDKAIDSRIKQEAE